MDQPGTDAPSRNRPPERGIPDASQPAETGRTRQERPAPDLQPTASADKRRPENHLNDSGTAATDGIGLPPRPPPPPGAADRQRLAERLEKIENPPSSKDALAARLTQLERGHPSSPWNEDGSPRPPVPRLSDFETPKPPLSDAEYADHRRDVGLTLDRAIDAGLTTKQIFAIDNDGEAWTVERRRAHADIIESTYAAASDVPCEHIAVIAGGLGGSGKTTVLEKHAGIDRSRFLTVNPDEIKEEFAHRGMTPDIPNLSPMESTPLTHEESSHVARLLAARAMAEGKNIIWDITLSSTRSASLRVEELRDAGYSRIDGIFVDIPIETSIARAEERHRRGHDRYLAGEGLGGRYLSEDLTRAQADSHFSSLNRRAFEEIKDNLDHWTIYDNSVRGRPPVLMAEGGMTDVDIPEEISKARHPNG